MDVLAETDAQVGFAGPVHETETHVRQRAGPQGEPDAHAARDLIRGQGALGPVDGPGRERVRVRIEVQVDAQVRYGGQRFADFRVYQGKRGCYRGKRLGGGGDWDGRPRRVRDPCGNEQ
jgi:hypothetical protein